MLALPTFEDLGELSPKLQALQVDEVVHCAGCLDYFDTPQLERVNIDFTTQLAALARKLCVRRFVYLSTAFSSGYLDRPVAETLHDIPPADPTEYTRTKREAEWRVAKSGVPYLIVRPSIVIGDSRTGRYSGKRYGLYQLWMGLERLLCDRYHAEYHIVAPRQRLNLVHQDSFVEALRAARQQLPDDSILHLTSRQDTAPTMRELWDLWMDSVARPRRVIYYERLADVPMKHIHPRQRAFLMFASVNIEIAAHPWAWKDRTLDQLRENGLRFADATLESITLCQQRFVSTSPRIRAFHDDQAQALSTHREVIEMTGTTQRAGNG